MRIPLNGGAYQARSIIADAQRCVNLYPELNPEDAPVKYTYYPTPGLDLVAATGGMVVRCLYRASTGALFACVDSKIYYINSNLAITLLGNLSTAGSNIVSMSDNGLAILIVDGTNNGYAINLANNAFSAINPTNFYGADRVDYVDTYFILNNPNTSQLYISLSLVSYDMLVGGNAFDPLDIAAKTGSPDNISSVVVLHRELWLIGTQISSEVWYNSGAADFTYQELPGAFIEHGCAAKYSIAKQDLSCYWLSRDAQGQCIVFRGAEYIAKRISTHAIETAISKYATISDAIGFTYQQEGHTFYVLIFPSADATWVYDQSIEEWHRRSWVDNNGKLHRHRANCCASAYGRVFVGDWQNGNIYAFNLDTYTDNGQPIVRIRSFPHMVDNGNRVIYKEFIADMDYGEILDSSDPQISLKWSDDHGKSYGNPLEQSCGKIGEYTTQAQWNRLGYGRDRVFELLWSFNGKTALNGAFVDTETLGT